MSESENSQISLYRLSLDKVNKKLEKDSEEKHIKFEKIETLEKCVEHLILSKKSPYNKFKLLKLKKNSYKSKFTVRIFADDISLNVKWVNFFKSVVDETETSFFSKMNLHRSFIAFIYDKNELFAFCGGLGSHIIKDYTDDDFGISVITRLLERDNVELRRAINRSLTGSEVSSDRFFKANYKIANEDNFGKMFKSIYTSLPKEILWEKLGVPKREKDRAASVVARSYFQLGRSLSYKELLSITEKIAGILQSEPLFELNKIKKISSRDIGGKDLIKDLSNKLAIDVFKAFKKDMLSKYDLLNKNIDQFVNATTFVIRKGVRSLEPIEGLSNFHLSAVFEALSTESFFTEKLSEIDIENIDQEKDLESLAILKSILNLYKIESQNFEGELLTSGSIWDHIQAEIEYEGGTYFFLEEEWYVAKDGFLDDVNIGCKELIEQLKVDDLLVEKWNPEKHNEDDYIEKYFVKEYSEYVYPLHRVLHNKIELCDLLIKKDRSVYFVHIKTGFDGSVRDLVSQIYLSAKLFINEKVKSASWEHNSLIEGYFKALKAIDGDSDYTKKFKEMYKHYKKQTFVNIFKENVDNFYFVFAIVDDSKSERNLPADIKKFKSTVAKMSLINLEKDIATISTRSASLRFVQITRE